MPRVDQLAKLCSVILRYLVALHGVEVQRNTDEVHSLHGVELHGVEEQRNTDGVHSMVLKYNETPMEILP